jgi:predicted signal transduction protein with EAL and GGDEF domain
VPIGVSLGLAVAPDHGRTLDELMAHADLALYAAKEAGRGRHELYVPRLGDRRRRRVAIEQGLRDALARGALSLHWQPCIAIEGWQVIGAEALLRWEHPTLGPVPPVEAVRVAEECGLIVEIGAWVMRQACREAAQLPATLAASVNVSAAQLRRDDFAALVRQALGAAALPPPRLEIEVTESLLIDAESAALSHLHALRSIGVRVALDDFGTGYSSLAYLRRFPFDTLKIDRAFVRELMSRHDARAIVKTILALAQTLGMHTLAEGVEEPAQLDRKSVV